MFRSITFCLIIGLGAAAWLAWPNYGTAITSGQKAPEFTGEHWLNSRPLTIAGLQGRVVLVEFWTYG
jgi:hypothetical protein